LRNVLVIAYYFPPLGLSGVQRTLKFIKYLPSFGWKPTVLTVEPRAYFAHDATLMEDLDSLGIDVIRTRSIDPLHVFRKKGTVPMPNEATYKLLTVLNQAVFIPDSKVGWKRYAVRKGTELLREGSFQAIFATAPPYTDFLIARDLKKHFNIPLVLDYRDAWLANPLHRYITPFHHMMHRRLEDSVLREADAVVTINRTIKELILTRYRRLTYNDITIIPQGYDANDFARVAPRTSRRMRITYAGTFYHNRTPRYMIEAFRRFLDRVPGAAEKSELCFVGQFRDENLSLLRKHRLEKNVVVTGYLPHKDAVAYLAGSDVLWMMLGGDKGDEMISTGKLFEYLGARKPILGCVPPGEARTIIEESGAGFITDPADVDAITKTLEHLFSLYQRNALPAPGEDFVQQYERKALTGHLAYLLSNLLSIGDEIAGAVQTAPPAARNEDPVTGSAGN